MNNETLAHLSELNSELRCAVENLFVLSVSLEDDRFVLEVITKAIRSVYNHIADISSAMQDDIEAAFHEGGISHENSNCVPT